MQSAKRQAEINEQIYQLSTLGNVDPE